MPETSATAPHHDPRPVRSPDQRWRRTAEAAGLWHDGAPTPTIFERMSAAAAEHEAVNLGQGFPDRDGPEQLLRLAADAVLRGPNQYAPGAGLPALRQAVAMHRTEHWGVTEDPESEVLVTTGTTEAITATVLAFVEPGEEVITVEPFYDAHAAAIALAGARHVRVPVSAPDFQPDPERLLAAVTDRTRLLVLNTPHNPTGAVYPPAPLRRLIEGCAERGVLVLSDEVYDHLVYDGEHVTLRALDPTGETVLTASSAGKSFAVTGWKVGWLTGAARHVAAVRAVKQYLTFSSGPAYQQAVAAYLPQSGPFLAEQRARLRRQRDLLVDGLRAVGLEPTVPQAGYFVTVDLTPWGTTDAMAAALEWTRSAGVTPVPVSALCASGSETLSSWLRLAFCKEPDVLAEGMQRLARHADTLRR